MHACWFCGSDENTQHVASRTDGDTVIKCYECVDLVACSAHAVEEFL